MYWYMIGITLGIALPGISVIATPLDQLPLMQQHTSINEPWAQMNEASINHPSHVQPGGFPPSQSMSAQATDIKHVQGKTRHRNFADTLLKLIQNQLGSGAISSNVLGNFTINNIPQTDLLSLSSHLNLTINGSMPLVPSRPKIPSCYNREVKLTQYWIPRENEWDETNDGDRVFLGGRNKNMPMYDEQKRLLGTVTPPMFNKCLMEGTCLLENGDMINIDDIDKPTFKLIGRKGRTQNIFGLGSGPQTLVPFISIAANDLPYGQKLYIPELDGLELGNGQQHNGCVRVDDSSWSFDDCQIDFFTPTYIDYLWLDLPKGATARLDDHCVLHNYVTISHLILMKASLDESIIPSLLNST